MCTIQSFGSQHEINLTRFLKVHVYIFGVQVKTRLHYKTELNSTVLADN